MNQKCLCLLCVVTILLSGCTLPGITVEPQPAATMEAAPDYSSQIQLIAQQQPQWDQTVLDGVLPSYYFHYAVTDLDWNGRLEILAMSTQGTGIFTYGTFYQVSQDLTQLEPCAIVGDDGYSLPELIMDFVPAGYDPESGTYYYVFKDDFRVGAAEYGQVMMPLSLKDGVVTFQTLGRMHTQVTDGVTREEYHRAQSPFVAPQEGLPSEAFLRYYEPITPAEYEEIIPAFLSTLQGFTANFEWFQVEGTVDTAALTQSWEVFRSSLD